MLEAALGPAWPPPLPWGRPRLSAHSTSWMQADGTRVADGSSEDIVGVIAEDPAKPPFYTKHDDLDVPRLKHWRCVPMTELNKTGPEVAALEGKAVVISGQAANGEPGLSVPRSPPGFRPLPPPPGKFCSRAQPCEDMPDVRLLRDRFGDLFWVTLRPAGDPRLHRQPGDLLEDPTVDTGLHKAHASQGSEDLYQPSLLEQAESGPSFACSRTNYIRRKERKRINRKFWVLPTLGEA